MSYEKTYVKYLSEMVWTALVIENQGPQLVITEIRHTWVLLLLKSSIYFILFLAFNGLAYYSFINMYLYFCYEINIVHSKNFKRFFIK